ncbi:WXG100 family type VII secretion target [Schumannella sp. 10F1B-5-1]|uniref:WXG100 family type VII secretion target n=1 Tax=Schumannella sp. 10F1B-5-1 TaxID=2590780 RepID=UPI001131168E|nr:WXG100 family type VII secretion target [Schumannella sp. 10F1B-5-1]TPW76746.1 WXG100 family type VII secretion target [Schumannella sp. 10F1B-5-1]
MTDTISAAEGALRDGAEAARRAHDDVNATVRRIQSHLDTLQGAWIGSAATAHDQLTQRWQADVQKLQTTLAHFEEALRATDRDQVATEQSHQQTIAGLGGLMGGQ